MVVYDREGVGGGARRGGCWTGPLESVTLTSRPAEMGTKGDGATITHETGEGGREGDMEGERVEEGERERRERERVGKERESEGEREGGDGEGERDGRRGRESEGKRGRGREKEGKRVRERGWRERER